MLLMIFYRPTIEICDLLIFYHQIITIVLYQDFDAVIFVIFEVVIICFYGNLVELIIFDHFDVEHYIIA
jgi:hypothetical protein